MTGVSLGIDPGNSHTGLAVADAAGGLLAAEAITMYPGEVERSVEERVLPAIRWLLPRDAVRVTAFFERPPLYRRSDVSHGSEAQIGYAEGWLSGLVAGGLRSVVDVGLQPLRRVEVSTWRTSMLATLAHAGRLVEAPTRKTVLLGNGARQDYRVTRGKDSVFDRTFVRCGHVESFASFAALSSAHGGCSACGSKPAKTPDPAQLVRDAWKDIACSGVRHLWPDRYAAVVAGPRERARSDKPDYHLAGVADACEAAWIAVHGSNLTHDSITR